MGPVWCEPCKRIKTLACAKCVSAVQRKGKPPGNSENLKGVIHGKHRRAPDQDHQ